MTDHFFSFFVSRIDLQGERAPFVVLPTCSRVPTYVRYKRKWENRCRMEKMENDFYFLDAFTQSLPIVTRYEWPRTEKMALPLLRNLKYHTRTPILYTCLLDIYKYEYTGTLHVKTTICTFIDIPPYVKFPFGVFVTTLVNKLITKFFPFFLEGKR